MHLRFRPKSALARLLLAAALVGVSACGGDGTGPDGEGGDGGGDGGTGTLLTTGAPLTGRAAGEGSETIYRIVVPTGATSLVVTTSGGTGDLDLYLRQGQAPTESANDCASEGGDNDEVCAVPSPAAGTWYIMLQGFEAYSGVTLLATVNGGSTGGTGGGGGGGGGGGSGATGQLVVYTDYKHGGVQAYLNDNWNDIPYYAAGGTANCGDQNASTWNLPEGMYSIGGRTTSGIVTWAPQAVAVAAGSCARLYLKAPPARVSFWIGNAMGATAPVVVTLNGPSYQQFTITNLLGNTPSCGGFGTVTLELPDGLYQLSARDANGKMGYRGNLGGGAGVQARSGECTVEHAGYGW